jgi:hypothetical protein
VESCFGNPPTCYCDAVCYAFNDCCQDIDTLGCVKPSYNITSGKLHWK